MAVDHVTLHIIICLWLGNTVHAQRQWSGGPSNMSVYPEIFSSLLVRILHADSQCRWRLLQTSTPSGRFKYQNTRIHCVG